MSPLAVSFVDLGAVLVFVLFLGLLVLALNRRSRREPGSGRHVPEARDPSEASAVDRWWGSTEHSRTWEEEPEDGPRGTGPRSDDPPRQGPAAGAANGHRRAGQRRR
jgi:hypothetical protein